DDRTEARGAEPELQPEERSRRAHSGAAHRACRPLGRAARSDAREPPRCPRVQERTRGHLRRQLRNRRALTRASVSATQGLRQPARPLSVSAFPGGTPPMTTEDVRVVLLAACDAAYQRA